MVVCYVRDVLCGVARLFVVWVFVRVCLCLVCWCVFCVVSCSMLYVCVVCVWCCLMRVLCVCFVVLSGLVFASCVCVCLLCGVCVFCGNSNVTLYGLCLNVFCVLECVFMCVCV